MRSQIATVTKMLYVAGAGIALFLFLVGWTQTSVRDLSGQIREQEIARQKTDQAIVRIDENIKFLAEKLREHKP